MHGALVPKHAFIVTPSQHCKVVVPNTSNTYAHTRVLQHRSMVNAEALSLMQCNVFQVSPQLLMSGGAWTPTTPSVSLPQMDMLWLWIHKHTAMHMNARLSHISVTRVGSCNRKAVVAHVEELS